jgi:hypothetical protein
MKLHDVVTQVIYFYLIVDEDSNRKNDGRKIGKKKCKDNKKEGKLKQKDFYEETAKIKADR